MKKSNIEWRSRQVLVSVIKPTPNNFKLRTEEGLSRFKTSVKNFGRAGTVILNYDFTLIDGNTRWEGAKEANEKRIWASLPSRQLTPKEFREMSALFDLARAGEVDVLRIKEELGVTKDFFKQWGFDMPTTALNKLAELEANEAVVNPTASRKIAEAAKEIALRPIQLLFKSEEAAEYIKLAESMYVKFKTDNVTDLSLKVMRAIKKIK